MASPLRTVSDSYPQALGRLQRLGNSGRFIRRTAPDPRHSGQQWSHTFSLSPTALHFDDPRHPSDASLTNRGHPESLKLRDLDPTYIPTSEIPSRLVTLFHPVSYDPRARDRETPRTSPMLRDEHGVPYRRRSLPTSRDEVVTANRAVTHPFLVSLPVLANSGDARGGRPLPTLPDFPQIMDGPLSTSPEPSRFNLSPIEVCLPLLYDYSSELIMVIHCFYTGWSWIAWSPAVTATRLPVPQW